ncbi:hypothetical protein C2845_PM05G31230 [Panicum miliaceum]|uniref:Uncharacterized protein n=1 Tax=Panicum miliaceum TaxID=4540 RepID=A0A3L6T3H4_PANMI|nr:hypothetical protein C2845_PM05G31230 [Panicum miliaceum]
MEGMLGPPPSARSPPSGILLPYPTSSLAGSVPSSTATSSSSGPTRPGVGAAELAQPCAGAVRSRAAGRGRRRSGRRRSSHGRVRGWASAAQAPAELARPGAGVGRARAAAWGKLPAASPAPADGRSSEGRSNECGKGSIGCGDVAIVILH